MFEDFEIDPETGDMVIDSSGDFSRVSGDRWLAQEILFRLKTTKGDFTLEPDTGADLEQFIGKPNTTTTHKEIEAVVYNALQIPGVLTVPSVEVVPLDEETVFILVEFPSIESQDKVVQLQSSLSLRKGLVFSRVNFTRA